MPQALRRALAPFVSGRRDPAAGPAAGPGPPPGRCWHLDTTEVREWARAQGIDVKDRGRVPAGVVARFMAATGR